MAALPDDTSQEEIGIVSDTKTDADANMLNVYVGGMCGQREREAIGAEGIVALALGEGGGNV